MLIGRKLGVKKIRIGARPLLEGLSFIEMGEDFWAQEGLWMEAISSHNGQAFTPRIIIGRRVRMSRFVHIAATNLVEIGDDVLVGSNVLITDHNHGQYSRRHTPPHIAPSLRPLDEDRQVRIGSNVWLGDGVVVAPGASIGEGAVIGAHSVVLGCIPPFAIASGAPATVRKNFNYDSQQWSSIR
jgi:lipopolysaccharide O-acetyltransferase